MKVAAKSGPKSNRAGRTAITQAEFRRRIWITATGEINARYVICHTAPCDFGGHHTGAKATEFLT